ncbi:hypothetical protein [Motiliproteus sp.]|uniref:hypothetical protein n=1 Tax=Motiliproteus sp. TaxID=1898955 RepID=UPI003BA9A566
MDRIFAIVNLDDVSGVVNAAGQAVINSARHSLDGTQLVLDFNHHRATIDGLFLPGTDVDAVIAKCEMLTHAEARALMKTPGWDPGEI